MLQLNSLVIQLKLQENTEKINFQGIFCQLRITIPFHSLSPGEYVQEVSHGKQESFLLEAGEKKTSNLA